MTRRIRLTCLAATLGLSILMLPGATPATSASIGGARGFAAPAFRAPAFRAPALRPAAKPAAAPAITGSTARAMPGAIRPSAGTPGLVRAAPPGFALHRTGLDPSRTILRHDHGGHALPLVHSLRRSRWPGTAWGWGGLGYYYDPSAYDPSITGDPGLAPPMVYPPFDPPPLEAYPPPPSRGCRADQQTVPRERGGVSTITIVRC